LGAVGARSAREVRLITVHFIEWLMNWFHIETNQRIRSLFLEAEEPNERLINLYYMFIAEMCILKVMFPRVYIAIVRSRIVAELPIRQLSQDNNANLDGIIEYTDSLEEGLELRRTISEIRRVQLILSPEGDRPEDIRKMQIALEVSIDY